MAVRSVSLWYHVDDTCSQVNLVTNQCLSTTLRITPSLQNQTHKTLTSRDLNVPLLPPGGPWWHQTEPLCGMSGAWEWRASRWAAVSWICWGSHCGERQETATWPCTPPGAHARLVRQQSSNLHFVHHLELTEGWWDNSHVTYLLYTTRSSLKTGETTVI